MIAKNLEQIGDNTLDTLFREHVIENVYKQLMDDLLAKAKPILRKAAEDAVKEMDAAVRARFDLAGDRMLMRYTINGVEGE